MRAPRLDTVMPPSGSLPPGAPNASRQQRRGLVVALLAGLLGGCAPPLPFAPPPRMRPSGPGNMVTQAGDMLIPPGAPQAQLPFELQDGFVLLRGTVRGVSGVFILDTGTPFPFLLNNTVVPLALVGPGSPGKAGSGQTFQVHAHADAGPISVAGAHHAQSGPVLSGNLAWLTEQFRPDFLGFAGYPLVSEHEMWLDYRQHTLQLHRLDAQGVPRVPHTPVRRAATTLHFDGMDGGRPHLPTVQARVEAVALSLMFDTGTEGVLTLTPKAHAQLQALGAISLQPNGYLSLAGLHVGGHHLANQFRHVETQGSINRLSIGYATLALYRSIWNFKQGHVTLLPA